MSDVLDASTAIAFEHVSVGYRLPRQPLGTFKEFAVRRLRGERVEHADVWALRDVTFDVRSGEIFGVIGANGAGKSTLLKVVSRVLHPTSGRVRVRGRVAPLLELGAGFHPDLTGRENVFLNGTLLGRSRNEIDAHMNAILGFAELGRAIEHPLRTYSTGMVARLGFAVATAWRPDILILDEVMAVGDLSFQQKCQSRLQEFRRVGSTILVVSHGLSEVARLCSRVAWLENGTVKAIGGGAEVTAEYKRSKRAVGAPVDPAPAGMAPAYD